MMRGLQLRDFLRRLSAPREREEVSGITILILQKSLVRFSGEQLSSAMQKAWGRKYDETNFYGMSTFDGEGGLLKVDAMFFTIQHFDRRVDASSFGENEIPFWAEHRSYTSIDYHCRGGISDTKLREQFSWLLARFCTELLDGNTAALLFVEEKALIRFDAWFAERLRREARLNPRYISAEQQNHN